MELVKEPNKLIVKYRSLGFGMLLMAIGAVLFYQLYLQYIAHPNRFTDKMGGLLASGSFMFIIGWFAAVTKTYTFDKVSKKFTWVKRRLLWSSKGEVSLSEIKRVVVEKGSMSSSQDMTRLSIWTDYKTIPFTAGMTAKGLADYSLAKEIKSFIGLREEEEPEMPPLEPRINSLLGTGNKMEAIKLMRREEGIPLNEAHQRVTKMMNEINQTGMLSGGLTNIVTATKVAVNGKEVTDDEAKKIMDIMKTDFKTGDSFLGN